jgi:hypothetical protein
MANEKSVKSTTCLYKLEEMGRTPFFKYPYKVILYDIFLQEKIETGELTCSTGIIFPKKKITRVGCPFCEIGLLRLISAVPQYRAGIDPWGYFDSFLNQVFNKDFFIHISDDLKYICSNQDCQGTFYGTIHWAETNRLRQFI